MGLGENMQTLGPVILLLTGMGCWIWCRYTRNKIGGVSSCIIGGKECAAAHIKVIIKNIHI